MPVDVEDAVDLGYEPVGEAKVSVGRADDRGESCRVGETCVIRVGVREALRDDGGELVAAEGSVFVSEADAAVELRVAGEAFLDAGHADEDDAHSVAVVEVADLFESGGFEPVGFVDDEQLGVPAVLGFGVNVGVDVAVLGVVDCPGDVLAGAGQALVDLLDSRGDGWGEERGTALLDCFGHGRQRSCAARERVPLLPFVGAGVVTGGECLADPGWPVAEADVAVRADGVCELREPAVLPRGHERGPRVCVGWWRFFELVEVAAEEPAPVIARLEEDGDGFAVVWLSRWHRFSIHVGPGVALRGRVHSPVQAQLRGGGGCLQVVSQRER